jgi:metal-responsive CopG/Arc/MetJ family transcriptional regulator
VKTAISVPDRLFERVERHAKRLGLSRSAFFATAAERLADELDDKDLTAQIDRALAEAADEDTAFVRRAAERLLGSDGDEAATPTR